jgi:hypothetical protein
MLAVITFFTLLRLAQVSALAPRDPEVDITARSTSTTADAHRLGFIAIESSTPSSSTTVELAAMETATSAQATPTPDSEEVSEFEAPYKATTAEPTPMEGSSSGLELSGSRGAAVAGMVVAIFGGFVVSL